MRSVREFNHLFLACNALEIQQETAMCRTAFALSILFAAISEMTMALAQEQTPGATLSKTGLLGIGVEPGFCAKGLLVDRPSVLTELKVTEAQKARLEQAMTESGRLAQRSGRESAAIRAQLVARGDREGLAEFDEAHTRLVLYDL